nr:hypothetical protein [Crenalkalicoccus roseus]
MVYEPDSGRRDRVSGGFGLGQQGINLAWALLYLFRHIFGRVVGRLPGEPNQAAMGDDLARARP